MRLRQRADPGMTTGLDSSCMTTHEHFSVLPISTAKPAVTTASPRPSLVRGVVRRSPSDVRLPAEDADGSSVVPDGRALQVLNIVRSSGAVTVDGGASRPADRAALEGLLTAMILTAGEGLPMTPSSFAWMLHQAVSPRVREALGVRADIGYAAARARGGRLARTLIERGDSPGLDGGSGRLAVDEMTSRLLGAAWRAQPTVVRERWLGDIALTGGFITAAGTPSERPGVRGDRDAGSERDAGWFLRNPAANGTGVPYRWGYEVQLAVVVPPPARAGWVPGSVVGLRLHRPGLCRPSMWLGMLTDALALHGHDACPPVGCEPEAPRVWRGAGWHGQGPGFVHGATALGYRVPGGRTRAEGPSGAVGKARVGAEAALGRTASSRQGTRSVLGGLSGTSLVMACELTAWHLSVVRRGNPGGF